MAPMTTATQPNLYFDSLFDGAQSYEMPPYQQKLDAATFQFINQNPPIPVWDVSIQKPYRKFLGKLEYCHNKGGWFVISVNRVAFSDDNVFSRWQDAARHLEELYNQQNRAAIV